MGIKSTNSSKSNYNFASNSGSSAIIGGEFLATGGNTGTYTDADGNWKFHAFLSSGYFTVSSGQAEINYLVK